MPVDEALPSADDDAPSTFGVPLCAASASLNLCSSFSACVCRSSIVTCTATIAWAASAASVSCAPLRVPWNAPW